MQIYDAIKNDHDKMKQILNDLQALKEGDDRRRHALVNVLRDIMIPHSRAEEAILYNQIRMIEPAKSVVSHGYGEHIEAEALLRALQLADRIDFGWKKTVARLQRSLEHHMAEEEDEVFAAARQLFTDEEAEMLGQEFIEMKPKIKEEGIFDTTMDLAVNMLPPRVADGWRVGLNV